MPGSKPAFPPLTPELRDRFVGQVAKTVRELCVLEDKAYAMADHLLTEQKAGSFDEIESIPKLAARLTQELHGNRGTHTLFRARLAPFSCLLSDLV